MDVLFCIQKNITKREFLYMSEKQTFDLSFFMPGQTVEAEEVKVPISKRFVDKKGNVITSLSLKPLQLNALMNWKKKTRPSRKGL